MCVGKGGGVVAGMDACVCGLISPVLVLRLNTRSLCVVSRLTNPCLCSYPTQWASVPYSLRDEDSIKRVLEGTDVVVNLVGKHYDTKHLVPSARTAEGRLSNVNFALEEVQAEAPAKLARLAKAVGVERFIHVSALGADAASDVRWLRTKGEGEQRLKEAFPTATIVRPGRLFGPEDRLLNWFATNAQAFGVVPLFNGGDALLQPTYVSDVVDAVVKLVEEGEEAGYDGKVVELANPTNFTWRELMDFTYDVRSVLCVSPPGSLLSLFVLVGGRSSFSDAGVQWCLWPSTTQVTWQKPRVVDLPQGVGEMAATVLQQFPNPILTVGK